MEYYDYGYYEYNESSTSVNDAETFCDNSEVTDFKGVYMPSLYAIIFVAGLLGNSLVIVIKVLYEKLKTITDLYMMNLAIADLILLCTLPLLVVDAQIGWTFGTFMCKVVNGVHTVNFYSCIFILTCMTINRYHAIVQATKMPKYKIIHGRPKLNTIFQMQPHQCLVQLQYNIPTFILNALTDESQCAKSFLHHPAYFQGCHFQGSEKQRVVRSKRMRK
ncbi:C-C chemokine receptor type 9-like [Pristis pectinata]|uniref:C-C chemokine receptor type 9-like n=1 Tax=Pristis pectinata TaxID=685728 RepID=UPI00223C8EC5|nr:C-C chemokine receptor type 9-like [Pristis pectinata]